MENPLKSANPNLIEELFSRDPLELTEDQLNENTKQLVLAFRAEREAWESEKAKAKITGERVSGQTTKKAQKRAAFEALMSGSAKIDPSKILGG